MRDLFLFLAGVALGVALERLFNPKPSAPSRRAVRFTFHDEETGEDIMILTLTAGQTKRIRVIPRDQFNNPTTAEDATFVSSDEDKVTISRDAGDPLLLAVSSLGPVGAAQGTGRLDALIGEGVEEIVGTFDVNVIAGKAVKFDFETVPD